MLLATVSYCAAWQVYSLDVDTFKWSEHTPDVSGDPPSPRDCHSAVALPDGRHILVFGGGDSNAEIFFSSVALLDTQTWRWSSPKLQVRRRDNLASSGCRCGHAEGTLSGGTSDLKLQVRRSNGRSAPAAGAVRQLLLFAVTSVQGQRQQCQQGSPVALEQPQAAGKACDGAEPGQQEQLPSRCCPVLHNVLVVGTMCSNYRQMPRSSRLGHIFCCILRRRPFC